MKRPIGGYSLEWMLANQCQHREPWSAEYHQETEATVKGLDITFNAEHSRSVNSTQSRIITHILRFLPCQSSRSYIINSDRGDSSHVYLSGWPVTQTKALFSLPAPQKTSFFFGAAEKSWQECQEIFGSADTKVARSKRVGV